MTKAHIATDYGYCDVGRPNLSVVYAIVMYTYYYSVFCTVKVYNFFKCMLY